MLQTTVKAFELEIYFLGFDGNQLRSNWVENDGAIEHDFFTNHSIFTCVNAHDKS